MIRAIEEVSGFFVSNTTYTDVFSAEVPHPVVAPEGVSFPFSTYTVDRVETESKDCDVYSFTLYFWFDSNKFTEMAQFMDDIIPDIKKEFEFQAATVEFVEENLSFVGIINFLTYL